MYLTNISTGIKFCNAKMVNLTKLNAAAFYAEHAGWNDVQTQFSHYFIIYDNITGCILIRELITRACECD